MLAVPAFPGKAVKSIPVSPDVFARHSKIGKGHRLFRTLEVARFTAFEIRLKFFARFFSSVVVLRANSTRKRNVTRVQFTRPLEFDAFVRSRRESDRENERERVVDRPDMCFP